MNKWYKKIRPVFKKFLQTKNRLKYVALVIVLILCGSSFLYSPRAGREIPIVFAADERYMPYLGVAITSLAEHTHSKNLYHIYIIADNVMAETQKKLIDFFKSYQNIRITFLPIAEILPVIKRMKFPTDDYFSVATYFRFFVPQLFPQYQRILYLDGDLIILDDVANLYNMDLQGSLLGVAAQTPGADIQYKNLRGDYMRSSLGIDDTSRYFNAGVLLVDLVKARKENYTQKLLYTLKKLGRPPLYDQDVLNGAYALTAYQFPYTYNFEIQFAEKPDELPHIIHYSGNVKPWDYSYPGQEKTSLWNKLFWEYASRSPYKEELYQKVAELFCFGEELFIHTQWESYFKREENKRIVKCIDKDTATIIEETDSLIRLKWDRWGVETFKKEKEGVYRLIQ